MRKTVVNSIAFLLILVFAIQCKEKAPSTPTSSCATCKPVSDAKNFFYFKIGSWWVYEEENSGLRDSVYVIESLNDDNSYNFDVSLKSAHDGYNYQFWPVYYPNVYNGCSDKEPVSRKCLLVKRSKYKPFDLVSEANACFFRYSIADSAIADNVTTNNFIRIPEILESYELGAFHFNETLKICF